MSGGLHLALGAALEKEHVGGGDTSARLDNPRFTPNTKPQFITWAFRVSSSLIQFGLLSGRGKPFAAHRRCTVCKLDDIVVVKSNQTLNEFVPMLCYVGNQD